VYQIPAQSRFCYSGIRWRWGRRVVFGICAWLIACWLAIHGFNAILGYRFASRRIRIPSPVAGFASGLQNDLVYHAASGSSRMVDWTATPTFFARTPLMKPRMLVSFQAVTDMISAMAGAPHI